MAKGTVIRSVSKDGKITIPKKMREKYGFKRYVEIIEKEKGIEVRPHR
jgi:AbrB family looped-hinge helix DNA binding protein